MRIAVLGLGLMGAAVARRLHQQNHDVIGWNRRPEPAQALREQGIATAASAGEAIATADAVVLLLSDYAAIDATLFAAEGGSLAGKLIVQMGTIAPDESRTLAGRVDAAGAAYLEAPVLGSLPEAAAGRLLIMAGGEPEVFDRALPLLQALGASPRRIGGVGQGAALKLAMNQLIAGLTATFSLSLGLVRHEGVEVDEFMALLRDSALYAPTYDKKLEKYLAHEYGRANFPLKHLVKDLRLFRRAGEQGGLDTALTEAIQAACERAVEQGWGDQDYSVLYEALVSRDPDR